ncbi:hypothetical protein P3S67_022727 [Capsicum chacoense]
MSSLRACKTLRPLMYIDGVDMKPQIEVVKKGVYIVVAKPGRLKYMLAKKWMNLENCRVNCSRKDAQQK